jgi:hypothetical protein
VHKPNRTIHPDCSGIRTTVRKKIGEGLEQRPLNWRIITMVNAGDAAQI